MPTKTSFWMTNKGLAAIGLIAAVSYFLFVEHREHVFEFLPFLILLACPLMHIFMHGGHGLGGHSDHHQNHDPEEAYQRGLEEGRKLSPHKLTHQSEDEHH